ncbi:hypothetical protein [uncultured Fibrella sp.]|uniref:hypothetical protein n=1 Tax=uncultured Fibrella sp. TaxID=1284596 RepID=UPI0035C9E0CD
MKTNRLFRTLLALVLGLFIASVSYSQAPPTKSYSEVYYHKLKAGHTLAEARAVENEWKKLHQAQADADFITGWYMLSSILTSNPNNQEYDYITIKTFSDFGVMDNSYPDKVLTQVFGAAAKTKWADLIKRTDAIQAYGKMEIWETIDGVFAEKRLSPDKSPVWVLDLMQVKDNKYTEYVAMEKSMKALHKERIAMNNIAGWNLSTLLYPAGSEKGYSYATVNFYPTMKEMGDAHYGEAFQKAMPGQDIQKLIGQVYATRNMVREEVYFLQEFAVKTPPVQASK